jgi:hypothetical protein
VHNGHLKIADALPLQDVLVTELYNLRVKINSSTAHDSYEAWREGNRDDPCYRWRPLAGRERGSCGSLS